MKILKNSLFIFLKTSAGVETLILSMQPKSNDESLGTNTETSTLSSSNVLEDVNKTKFLKARKGVGSTESDLIFLVKKYFEIVGLVFFVWLLGK